LDAGVLSGSCGEHWQILIHRDLLNDFLSTTPASILQHPACDLRFTAFVKRYKPESHQRAVIQYAPNWMYCHRLHLNSSTRHLGVDHANTIYEKIKETLEGKKILYDLQFHFHLSLPNLFLNIATTIELQRLSKLESVTVQEVADIVHGQLQRDVPMQLSEDNQKHLQSMLLELVITGLQTVHFEDDGATISC
jgi:hypothetical protein